LNSEVQLIEQTCQFIVEQGSRYVATFHGLTGAAKFQFEHRLWQAQRSTNSVRFDLINRAISLCRKEINEQFNETKLTLNAWMDIKLRVRQYWEGGSSAIFESFLYAVEQSLYPLIANEDDQFQALSLKSNNFNELIHLYGANSISDLSSQILEIPGFSIPYQDHSQYVDLLRIQLEKVSTSKQLEVVVFPNLFYRNQHAYLVAQIRSGNQYTPLTIPFINSENGVKLDAILATETEIIRVFEFTRSYFLVDTNDPQGLVAFLLSIMPHKKAEQLIINLGYTEWGKFLIKQHFKNHLHHTINKLIRAPGTPGMVMHVFTLADYPMVFKTIRKSIPISKNISQEEVLEKYNLVAKHDRVGRLADTQYFSYWAFPTDAFDERLLDDLRALEGSEILMEGDEVSVTQLFTERKMVPLNLFLETADIETAMEVVIDYGNAIKELAMSNIFPGDFLLKNFGVTPELRVVFYDYDEVTHVTDCRFLELMKPKYEEQMWDMETWDVVHQNDVFPEEWEKFLLPEGPLRMVFRQHHAEIFEISFWNKWKDFHLKGNFVDLQPYVPIGYLKNE
jgi:isocitrate dehydrogenase kinase/phosphatase